mmetsp:Transcript_152835/g.265600  ORF Transcript_152835/g.265600 Transcript_152835/m.265600 type:complete len:711 (-) Transcript_152835:100-2232(-)
MVRAGAKSSTVCAGCGETRKKFPTSWTLNNCNAYCPLCWARVKCMRCGHHDPKGGLISNSWACRKCHHQHRVTSQCNLHEDCHRVIIEDGNGAALGDSKGSPAEFNFCKEDEQEEDQLDEEDDELSALPTLAPVLKPAQQDASHIILLLDASGSMRSCDVASASGSMTVDPEEDLLCRLDAAVNCALLFVRQHGQMHPRDVFSLATFADCYNTVFAVHSYADAQTALGCLTCRGSGGTSYRAALSAAVEFMHLRPSSSNHIVMLSDGRPADTKAALEFFQSEILNRQRSSTHLHGIGFGASVKSFAPLQQLACLSGGTFELSSCSTQGICKAFTAVSSTITSISTGSFSGIDGLDTQKRTLRAVHFEPPELGVFGRNGTLRFSASRCTFQYDGAGFKQQSWPPAEVARRLRPCMRGGMRLVYAFQDAHQAAGQEEGSWMVAKSSRFLDEVANSSAVVESHAKSTAVARYFAACFNEKLKATAAEGVQEATLFFVPCFVYRVDDSTSMPEDAQNEPRAFAAERYLPGAFLKYNSNNGYVGDSCARHHEIIQAFSHFTFAASGGRLLVADLQGVALESEALLTDPQVLSFEGSFGPGDLRARGICSCLAAHRCGPTCRKLGLTPVSGALLRHLGAARAGIGRTRRSQGKNARPASRATSGLSDEWEKLSQPSVAEGDWERINEKDLDEFALSDGGLRSSQGSASSWMHLLDF